MVWWSSDGWAAQHIGHVPPAKREDPLSSVGLGRVVLGSRVQCRSCAVDAKILQIPGRIVQMTSNRRGQNQRMSCIHHQGSRKLSVLV